MGSFDFTYELPNNFDKRTQQFLLQMQASDVADAFVNCKYEYDDVGLRTTLVLGVIIGIKMLSILRLKVRQKV